MIKNSLLQLKYRGQDSEEMGASVKILGKTFRELSQREMETRWISWGSAQSTRSDPYRIPQRPDLGRGAGRFGSDRRVHDGRAGRFDQNCTEMQGSFKTVVVGTILLF